VLDQAGLGSLEFAAGDLEVPLLVVLGHTSCGAIQAASDSLDSNQPAAAEMAFFVEALKPAVAKAKTIKPKATTTKKATTTTSAEATAETKAAAKTGESTTTTTEAKSAAQLLIDNAAQVNVEMIIEKLKTAAVIGDRIKKNWLLVVGGVYDISTGKVDFTVGLPDTVKQAFDDSTSTTAKPGTKTSDAGTTTTKKA
jgi:carbonic anhydrase